MKTIQCRNSLIAALVLSVTSWLPQAKAQSGMLLYSGSSYGGIPCSGGVTMPSYDSPGNYCAPDSIAMLFGYWYVRGGYSSLMPGALIGAPSTNGNGSNLYLTTYPNVQSLINTLADSSYCNTDPTNGTLLSLTKPSIVNYALSCGYNFNVSQTRYNSTSSWNTLVNSINAGDPMLFYIDLNGDGTPDHITPVFGYKIDGNGVDWYATYASEDEIPHWVQFQPLGPSGLPNPTYAGGVSQEFQITPQATPEPSTLSLAIIGGALSLVLLRKRHHSSANAAARPRGSLPR